MIWLKTAKRFLEAIFRKDTDFLLRISKQEVSLDMRPEDSTLLIKETAYRDKLVFIEFNDEVCKIEFDDYGKVSFFQRFSK
jgi:predicted lipoprotein